MQYKSIGNLSVSNIILGGANLGSVIDEKTSFALIDNYIEYGGNCIDTARLYGFIGKSEECIGRWLALNPSKRDKILISTKGGHPELKTMDISRLSEYELEKDLDDSLKALGVDYIDIYWLHRDDASIPAGELIETLNKFVKKGKIKKFGASNWQTSRILEANKYAKSKGIIPFAASQVQWSLAYINKSEIDPTTVAMDDEEYGIYKNIDISVFAYSSQAMGIFSLLQGGGEEALRPVVKRMYLNDKTLERYERANELSKKYNVPISAIVLSYIYSDYNISASVLIGPVNTEFLLDSISKSDFTLTEQEIEWLKA